MKVRATSGSGRTDVRTTASITNLVNRRPVIVLTIIGVVALTGTLIPSVALADVQELSGGGCGEEPGCYPVVLDLTPVLVFKEVNGQNVEVEIHVSFGGSGWHGTNETPVTVSLKIVGQPLAASTLTSTSDLGTDPENFGTCYTMHGMYIHHVTVAVHTAISFYVEVVQIGSGGICKATSAINAVNVDEEVQAPAGLDPPRPGELGAPSCVKGLGDPIDLTTGNVYIQRSDLVLPTDLGLPIEIARHYNSLGSSQSSWLGPNMEDGAGELNRDRWHIRERDAC